VCVCISSLSIWLWVTYFFFFFYFSFIHFCIHQRQRAIVHRCVLTFTFFQLNYNYCISLLLSHSTISFAYQRQRTTTRSSEINHTSKWFIEYYRSIRQLWTNRRQPKPNSCKRNSSFRFLLIIVLDLIRWFLVFFNNDWSISNINSFEILSTWST